MYDFTIIGGGIVGLTTALSFMECYPQSKILVLEKEDSWAKHQTGRNSGVIHSGIYYKPGSFKSKFTREGKEAIVRFSAKHGIEHEICGKVIVATKNDEIPRLEKLFKQGKANGLKVKMIQREELMELEPHANGLKAIHVPEAGIINYKVVCEKIVSLLKECEHDLLLNQKVKNIVEREDMVTIETETNSYETHYVINCAGLYSDHVAKFVMSKNKNLKIVPFRGEYYKLKKDKHYLVKNLIYPVPNPEFPFMGVHFTRMIGGDVEVGPNAILSFKREGYYKTSFEIREFLETISFPGVWKLGGKYWKEGVNEFIRSVSKKAFIKDARRLIPDIEEGDLESAPAGVRAQALSRDGKLLDDFYFVHGQKSIHVCNAPSPAATASFSIGKSVVDYFRKHVEKHKRNKIIH